MPQLAYIGNGSLSGLHNLEELHIANNIELTEIHNSALSRRENGEENEVWPPLKKVTNSTYRELLTFDTQQGISRIV